MSAEANLFRGFNYARLIFELSGLKPELKPTNEREYRTAARRPPYSALSNAKMEGQGIEPITPAPRGRRLVSESA